MCYNTDSLPKLIEAIHGSFASDEELDNFLYFKFSKESLATYSGSTLALPNRIALLIKTLEKRRKLTALLRVFAGEAPNPDLRALAAEMLADEPKADPDSRPSLFGNRPFINRDLLWRNVASFADGQAAQRILVIHGAKGSGKSHSRYLVSHWCGGRGQLIPINLATETTPEASVAELVQPIAAALEVEFERRFDDLAQEARYTKWLGDRLVAHLKIVDKNWWILVDGLNLARVGDDVLQLVIRLAEAVDLGECPRLWLVLIGIEPLRLKGDLPNYVCTDESAFPTSKHVMEWLQRLAKERKKELQDATLTAALTQLDAILDGGPRDHGFWRPFLTALSAARNDLDLAEG